MRKVLIIITTGFEATGGLTTVMMNYYRAMDKRDLFIDFASVNDPDNNLINELNNNKSEYYNLGNRKKNIINYIHNLGSLLKGKKYDVIHINGNSSTMIIEALIAKQNHVNEIICHTHTSQSEYPILHKILKPFFQKCYTKAIAVSDKSGQWLYGTDYIVLNNAIDVQKYSYNNSYRIEIRRNLNIQGKFVIGTVGKLTVSKNQSFLIDVFSEYHKSDKNSCLIIAGGGELEDRLKEKVKSLGVEEDVLFLGMRNDVEKIIQCFDVFLFTSVYEGFGMVLVEAQASGLYCIASDSVPIETKVTNYIEYLSVNDPITKWVERIVKVKNMTNNRDVISKEALTDIKKNGFDIKFEAKKLKDIYLKDKKL